MLEVLKELKADDKPMFYVFNKADKLPADTDREAILKGREGLFISAKSQENLQDLLAKVAAFFAGSKVRMKVLIPFAEGGLVTKLHKVADVQSVDYNEQGTVMEILLPASDAAVFEKYKLGE